MHYTVHFSIYNIDVSTTFYFEHFPCILQQNSSYHVEVFLIILDTMHETINYTKICHQILSDSNGNFKLH
jgi:hypothetical protein